MTIGRAGLSIAANPMASEIAYGQTQNPPFTLPWSHYLILMRIKDENERKFYEIVLI